MAAIAREHTGRRFSQRHDFTRFQRHHQHGGAVDILVNNAGLASEIAPKPLRGATQPPRLPARYASMACNQQRLSAGARNEASMEFRASSVSSSRVNATASCSAT